MDDVHEARVARIEPNRGAHALEVRLGGIEAGDATETGNSFARIAGGVGAQRMADDVHVLGLEAVLAEFRNQIGHLEADNASVCGGLLRSTHIIYSTHLFNQTGTNLRVEGQRTARPIDHNYVQIAGLQQFILHLGYPIRQWRINETVYDEFRATFGAEVGRFNAMRIVGADGLSVAGILFRVQNEARIDHTAGERKYVERSMDQMVPVARDVEASDFTEAPGLIFIWSGARWIISSLVGRYT